MKLFLRTLLVTILPVFVYAQDTTTVKTQAKAVADALLKGNFSVVVDHTYPKIVTAVGGKANMLATVKQGMDMLKAQGFSIESAVVGSPGKFYKAGTELHCLVPEKMVLKSANGSMVNNAYMLAISKDGGKYWYFLDVNRSTYSVIPKLFPNFNKALVIPEPTEPVMQ